MVLILIFKKKTKNKKFINRRMVDKYAKQALIVPSSNAVETKMAKP